ncbi:MAG: hypothetical protein ISR95_04585, partial [Candidatus Marinimicrobia bacterium]|nr:hypothetical protein [Candidatus Neomarinimicrobiota bacterium]
MELIKESFENLLTISSKIINYSNLGIPRIDFLRNILNTLIGFSGCDNVAMWLNDKERYIHCEISRKHNNSFKYNIILSKEDDRGTTLPELEGDSIYNQLILNIIRGCFNSSLPFYTKYGSFWSGDIKESFSFLHEFKPERYY